MSSSLLEQAIVDAEALKEAALKSAQAAILERYAPDVKKAIQVILEQEVMPMNEEEDPLAGLETDSLPGLDGAEGGGEQGGLGADMGDLPMPVQPQGPETSDTVNKLPLAATESEKLCACPDEDEEIEINFDELEKQMARTEPDDNIPDGMPTQDEEMDMGGEGDIQMKLSEEIEIDEDLIRGLFENGDIDSGLDVVQMEEECEPEEIKENVKRVAVQQPKRTLKVSTNQQQLKINENKGVLKNNILIKENNELVQVKKQLLEQNNKIKKTVDQLTKRLEEVNLSNAKLVCTNQALTSNSLNERQKSKLVEAISKAESVEEVNLIFETLQQTVGSGNKKSEPKSLNEVVSNKNTLKFPQRETAKSQNPVYNRWGKMAGITK